MTKKKDAVTAATNAGLGYALGPQPDGAVIVKIPDDFHLMVLRKAVEKQEKNSTAAGGTLSALADGDDPWLGQVQRALVKLGKLINAARSPANQIADTPIGKEIAEAAKAALAGEEPEPIDGRPGDVWAPTVPTPRPKINDLIVWPDSATDHIVAIEGYAPDSEAFAVVKGNGTALVVAHEPEPGSLVWRVRGALYQDATIPPSVAKDLPADDKLVSDAPKYENADDEPSASEPPKKTRSRVSAKPVNPAQRARNATHAGIGKGKRGGR